METDKIVLISISQEELREIVRDAVKKELNLKKEKELLSFKETCEFLGCSASALNKWKSENKIPYRKLGKRIYFSRSEITSALEESGNYKKLRELR
jgi:excisionase family DNA binding protein